MSNLLTLIQKQNMKNDFMNLTFEQYEAILTKAAELEAALADRSGLVCGDCDGSGWLENRVEGRYPCTCMTEAEPYQLLEQQLTTEQDKVKVLTDVLEFVNNQLYATVNMPLETERYFLVRGVMRDALAFVKEGK